MTEPQDPFAQLTAGTDAIASAGLSAEDAARSISGVVAEMPSLADLLARPVTSGPPNWSPCDTPTPSRYLDFDEDRKPYMHCRCRVCGRCGRHTGNATQGHYWALCRVTGTVRELHQCCPDDCELEAAT